MTSKFPLIFVYWNYNNSHGIILWSFIFMFFSLFIIRAFFILFLFFFVNFPFSYYHKLIKRFFPCQNTWCLGFQKTTQIFLLLIYFFISYLNVKREKYSTHLLKQIIPYKKYYADSKPIQHETDRYR